MADNDLTQDTGEQTSSILSSSLAQFEEFDDSGRRTGGADDKMHFLKDLPMNIYIELGRTQMQIKDILELERGYVIELDKMASEPVDVFVNNKKIAEGEVVVIDKHFGIRITSLVDPQNRMKELF
ncbi:MAG: flagellar motor switch protein FliN [Melioribacteraceae bacterium]|jgi:flagellar motor switch protein FliN/FliY|nr:flagellar motor switch protein FliN [Melioribacteraceae bacterium]MDP3442048.1 flagellar motor switch protein FliN [Ignavibacteria bacterium]